MLMTYGEGANGKTTEQNVMSHLMGDYARKIQPETLLARDRSGASNDVARLKGARFVPTVEVEDGGRLAESLVKQLTGQDRIAARFLYQEHFEFRPTGKIWLATNHRPEVLGTDHVIWRRILLIPYPVQFDAGIRDPQLEEKLLSELPGILNWMIEGFRHWKAGGLLPPDSILAATDAYRQEMDRIGNFLSECCKWGRGVKGGTRASRVYLVYRSWAKANGMYPVSARKFHAHMQKDHDQHRVDGKSGTASDYAGLLIVNHDYDEMDA